MLPFILGAGLAAYLLNSFSAETKTPKRRTRRIQRAKRVFISFAMEDRRFRDFLVSQAKNDYSPFSFADMSVRKAWPQQVWKRECRRKIRECDLVIVLLSKNTWHAGGSRWEIKCAREEGLRVIGMHIRKDDKGAIPPELKGSKVIEWTWENLKKTINS